jgi:hypothetical protein
MKTTKYPLIAAAIAAVLLVGCATAPVKPDGAAEARAMLTQLQSDPNLAGRAPIAMQEDGPRRSRDAVRRRSACRPQRAAR